MRTTLTLEPDVVRLIEETVHRQRQTFKEVVNEAIRRGLSPGREKAPLEPYRMEPHHAELAPGLDVRAFNRLADELEDEVILTSQRLRA